MRRRRSRARDGTLVALLVTVIVLGAGCGDDLDDDESQLVEATDALAVVCRDANQARLEELSAPGTLDRLRDQDPSFGGRVDDIAVTDRTITIDGTDAEVALTLAVTLGGSTSTVERIWVYEKIDSEWLLAEPPDCVLTGPGPRGE